MFDEPTFIKLNDLAFHNGVIEVKVKSKVLPDAPDFARGFIGVAFRINENNSEFEAIYVRPSNAQSTNQLRRNHTTQYFSYPDYKFDRLREESPSVYESYAPIALDEWIDLKIEVQGLQAKLFVNQSLYPVLIINDLKHGNSIGSIGLWVEVGTEGYFTDLKIDFSQK
ncbi:hypothetical protein [Pseudolactococcus hodotermopsidis]|uniref:hypothetical protein n=1 Tax=Pseudolactococcus hodotermopsidis TaxID=2709157 RepID=UPI001E392843|nr:hypothetical protein [Lactococcus hodotermopsidis]